jgi:hypothetical protein
MKFLFSMMEASLYIRTRDGKKRAFRFPLIAGLNYKEVPLRKMETLKPPGYSRIMA